MCNISVVATLSLMGCGHTSCLYTNPERTLVLKNISNTQITHFTPIEREVCVLQTLARFSWAPRLVCATKNYMMTTYMGEHVCTENLPGDYAEQVSRIVTDMKSVGVRQNDMKKQDHMNDFVIMNKKNVSLVDFGWASIHGKLNVNCVFGGKKFSATHKRPKSAGLDNGFKNKDERDHFVPPCKNGTFSQNGS